MRKPRILKIMFCPTCKSPLILKYSSINEFDILFCKTCLNGFTNPVPKDLSKYYHSNYWTTPGVIGNVKTLLFKIFQKRRKIWVTQYLQKGEILDVGAGEGRFADSLNNKFQVTSIDTPSSKIENKNVLRVDFLKWRTKKKFDAIVFWESLEHTTNPQRYLQKASSLLKKGGFIFVEYPRFDSTESRIFKNYWFHIDPPRHLVHLSEKGLETMLKRADMVKKFHTTNPALEYTIWGFVASILSIFNIERTDIIKQSRSMTFLILISPLLFLAVISQFIFSVMGQSPIGLIIAGKEN